VIKAELATQSEAVGSGDSHSNCARVGFRVGMSDDGGTFRLDHYSLQLIDKVRPGRGYPHRGSIVKGHLSVKQAGCRLLPAPAAAETPQPPLHGGP
jgi:hypothetical protein